MFLIYLIGTIILVVFIFWILNQKRIHELEKELEITQKEIEKERGLLSSCNAEVSSAGKANYGFDEFNRRMAKIKEERKQKILEELEKSRKVRAIEVVDFLVVSRITAFRYLEELEKEGKIEQIGVFGPNVYYRLK